MIHARKDYNRFQDPALKDPSLLGENCTPIAEDEPVFLIRGKDKFFYAMLLYYSFLTRFEAPEISKKVQKFAAKCIPWLTSSGGKTPDLPTSTKKEKNK